MLSVQVVKWFYKSRIKQKGHLELTSRGSPCSVSLGLISFLKEKVVVDLISELKQRKISVRQQLNPSLLYIPMGRIIPFLKSRRWIMI